jgi:hypothetical protein
MNDINSPTQKELVESFSRHSKLTNKYMIAILVISLIVAMNINPDNNVPLEFFGELKIELKYYYIISLSIISCLILLFSSTQLMALRIRRYYNQLWPEEKDKDYIDLTCEPTIFRVGPVSRMIFNKDIFYFNKNGINKNQFKVQQIVYFVLKMLIYIVTYIFPISILIVLVWKSGIFNFYQSLEISTSFIEFLIRSILIILSILSLFSFGLTFVNYWNITRKVALDKI